MRDVFILGTREYIHVDAHPAQLKRQVAHINIHPAGIFTAQGGKRTGMVGKHGHIHGQRV